MGRTKGHSAFSISVEDLRTALRIRLHQDDPYGTNSADVLPGSPAAADRCTTTLAHEAAAVRAFHFVSLRPFHLAGFRCRDRPRGMKAIQVPGTRSRGHSEARR